MIKTPEQKLSRNPQNAGYTNPLKSYDVPAKDNPDGTINVHAQPVYGIDPNHEPIDQYMAVRTVPGGTLGSTYDAVADDADKSFTVPAGVCWCDLSIFYTLASTATVGNRNIVISITEGANQIYIMGRATVIAAGQTKYTLAQSQINYVTEVNGVCTQPLISSPIPPGSVIRIWDAAAIDIAADDLTVAMTYRTYPV